MGFGWLTIYVVDTFLNKKKRFTEPSDLEIFPNRLGQGQEELRWMTGNSKNPCWGLLSGIPKNPIFNYTK